MPERERAARFRLIEQNGPGNRLLLESTAADGCRRIVISEYRGPALPASLNEPVIAPGRGEGEWSLTAAEGRFDFRARSVDRIDERPALLEPLHRPFALSVGDRIAVRMLLWLLRLPGGARLLRRWHAGRDA